jgi:hypothetical protein
MTLLLKDPDAALDYAVDWGAEYASSDSLIESEWDVSPVEEGGVAVVESEVAGLEARVKAAGGVAGRLYRLRNQVLLASGLRDSRSIMLRVETR